MNRKEFQEWASWTAKSQGRWVKDPIHNGQGNQELLIHRGGVNGYFIRVDRLGVVSVGSYEDALPHIGEAAFQVSGSYNVGEFKEAARRILNAMGLISLAEGLDL